MKREGRILFVDDDANILAGFQRQLGRLFDVATATDADRALELLDAGQSFAVIVSDMRMPGKDGVALLAEFGRRSPGTIRILLTGLADQRVAMRAINEGHVFAFLNKPASRETLEAVIEEALGHWSVRKNEREFIDKEINDIGLL